MKNEKIYSAWTEQNRRITVGQNFSSKVMGQIYRYEQHKTRWPFSAQQLVGLISARPLAKAALLGIGAVIGLIRIVCILIASFGPDTYCR